MGVVLGKSTKVLNNYKNDEKESSTPQNGRSSVIQSKQQRNTLDNNIAQAHDPNNNSQPFSLDMVASPPQERPASQNEYSEQKQNQDVYSDINENVKSDEVKLKAVVDDVSLRNSVATLRLKLNAEVPDVEEKDVSDGEEKDSHAEFELEVLSHAQNEVKNAMELCSLDKSLAEWATGSVAKQLKEIIFLTIKFKGTSLSRELRKKVTKVFVDFQFVQYSILFIQYAKTEISEIFHKDESVYSSEIDELNKEKKKLDKNIERKENAGNDTSEDIENPIENNDANHMQDEVVLEETTATEQQKTDIRDDVAVRLKQLRQMKHAQNIIGSIMAVNINCSNNSAEYRNKVAECGFVEILLEFLEIYSELNGETEKADYSYSKIKLNGRLRIFNYVLGTLVNMTRFCEFHYIFKCADTVERALPYLKCPLQLFAMKVLLALSSLIDESNNHLIMSDAEPIKLLLMYIRGASKDENNRFFGFELKELVEGVALIAQNDSNNKLIGDNGGVKTLSFAFLASTYIEDESEQKESLAACCNAIWRLSFNEDNRKKLREDVGLTEHLKKLKEMESSDLQEKASGSYWELIGKHMRNQNNEEDSKCTEEQKQHIMISYQWNYQEILLKVRDRLQEVGFNVWMDVDQMGGSTLEAMAKAVEDASIVLMAVSSEYKQSANCRSEAEYAFQLKRTTIPLMMQANYTADGWLGFIVGAKYWIEFIDPLQFDVSFEKLMKEISKSLEIDIKKSEQEEQSSAKDSTPTNQVTTTIASLSNWSSREVNAWLKNMDISLSDRSRMKYKHNIDGKLLLSLKRIKQEAPQAFYDICRQDLHFDFIETIRFSEELAKLT